VQKSDFISQWMKCGTLVGKEGKELLIGYGKRTWLANPDPSQPSFYFPDFFLKDKTPWFVHEQTKSLPITELLDQLNLKSELSASIKQAHITWYSPDKDFFNRSFHIIKQLIADGQLQKAVPFIVESAELLGRKIEDFQLMKSMRSILKYALVNQAHLYGFWEKGKGVLGATPEVLFQYNNKGLLNTMACAGTKNIQEDSEDLLSDPKELNEHELVVEGIKDALMPYGKVSVGKLRLLKLSKLMHLVTPLNLQIQSNVSFQEIIKALHPTPAVGAFPKNAGMEWLENYEKHLPRFRYGAPVGYFLPGKWQSKCYVSIRCMQWREGVIQIAAGVGVVQKSLFEKECAEIDLKLQAIKEMLSL